MHKPVSCLALAALLSALVAPIATDAHADAIDRTIELGELTITPRVNVRLRSEHRDNLSLDQTADDERWRLLLRTGLGASLRFHWLELLVDITDGRELAHEATNAEAPLDFTQLYLALHAPGGVPLTLKVGRQAMKIGSERLISTSSWSNKQRAWDAIRLDADLARFQLTALVGNEVKIDTSGLDHGDFGETLWGLFTQMEVSKRTAAELYVFGLYKTANLDPESPIRGEDGAKGDEHRITPGLRAHGEIESPAIDWEFEFAFQIGSRASDDINAFALSGGLGWTMPLPYAPRLGVEVNYASGDHDPEDGIAQTFQLLYGTTHGPYGISDLFRWQNMVELSPSLDIALHPAFELRFEHHTYWLAETADDWVNSSGKVLREGLAAASRYAGQEVSIIATWSPHELFEIEGGLSHFMPGKFMRQTGDVKSATFGYLSGAFKF